MTYDELYHHGIKGQKWGIRRYQNPDGTLTEEGKKRYGTAENLKEKRKKETIAKVTAATAAVATVAGAAAYVAKNPEIILTIGEKIAQSKVRVKDLSGKAISKGAKMVTKQIAASTERKEVSEILKERRRMLKNIPKMSTTELGNLQKRLEQEKTVRELVKNGIPEGRRRLGEALAKGGTAVASAAATGGLAYAGKKIVEKKDREAANYMFPNPNKKKK